jgi:hypothetical protein
MASAVAVAASMLAGCGGCSGDDCARYAEVTCEKACACSADPGCTLVWAPQIYETATRAECESTLRDICAEESDFDEDSCLDMVEDTSCSGRFFVHPMCPLGGGADAGGGVGPEILEVSAPERTPLATAAVRGRTTGASRVVVELEGGDSQVAPLAPGGDFCVDVPLPAGAVSAIIVHAIAESGALSEPAEVDVEQDGEAPEPPDPTCGGDECAAEEDCGNQFDDDCNALADDCDPACNGCPDDQLEPNDVPFAVPELADGTHELEICPCREDWFAFDVPAGGSIDATSTFEHSTIDIDLQLFRRADAEEGTDSSVASSATTTDTERIEYTAASGGTYYLRVYSFRDDGAGSYVLTVSAAPVSSSSR